jgi:putative ABC transport system permease protein
MNIFNKVTQKTLQKNRTRTIVTIIGIILSASMITAVTTFISSLLGYAEKLTIYQTGDWYGQYVGASEEGVGVLKADKRVSEVFISEDIGYSPISNPDNPAKPYIFVLGAGAGFFGNMPVRLTEGRLPQNSDEIIIPEHLISSGEKIKIGEVINLGLGKRVQVNQDTASGPDNAADTVLWQNTPYQNSEESSEL